MLITEHKYVGWCRRHGTLQFYHKKCPFPPTPNHFWPVPVCSKLDYMPLVNAATNKYVDFKSEHLLHVPLSRADCRELLYGSAQCSSTKNSFNYWHIPWAAELLAMKNTSVSYITDKQSSETGMIITAGLCPNKEDSWPLLFF